MAMPMETERLLLRDFVVEDWRAVHEYGSDPEVVRYLPWGPNTEEDSRDFIRRSIAIQKEDPRRRFEIGIVLKEEGRLIGGCGIRENNSTLREGNLGYVLKKDYWGRGIATEAARAAEPASRRLSILPINDGMLPPLDLARDERSWLRGFDGRSESELVRLIGKAVVGCQTLVPDLQPLPCNSYARDDPEVVDLQLLLEGELTRTIRGRSLGSWV